MTINPNNFEAYLLDYLEGNLDPLLTAELMAFLAENPEFEKYIPDFEAMPISAAPVTFQDKELLKKDYSDIKQISAQNFDELCIAFFEGLLEPGVAERLTGYVDQHEERKKDFEIHSRLKLHPDLSVTCKEKSAFKKSAVRSLTLRYLYYGLAVAASVAFVVWLAGNNQPSFNEKPPVVSEQLPGSASREIPAIISETPVEKNRVNAVPSNRVDTHAANSESATPPLPEREPILLSALEPKSSYLQSQINLPPIQPQINLSTDQEPAARGLFADLFSSDSFLQTLISRIDFWKTAESAIDGINYLTETKLSITRTVDEDGNLTSLLLSTESYTIAGNKAK